MANSQKNSRFVIVGSGTTAPGDATLAAFTSAGTTGEIAVFSKDGTAAAAGEDCVIALKTADGVEVSDVLKASKIKSYTAKAYAAATLKKIAVSDITVPSTTGGTADYIVDIRIPNYGSLSVTDFMVKHGQYFLTQTGSKTASDVVDGLISNLNSNFSKMPNATASTNPLFTFEKGYNSWSITVTTAPDTNGNATVTVDGVSTTVALLSSDSTSGAATKIAAALDAVSGYTSSAASAVVTLGIDSGAAVSVAFAGSTTNAVATSAGTAANAALVITGKDQAIELGKDEGRAIEFSVRFDEEDQTATVTTMQDNNPGVGTGKIISNLEWFYNGAKGDVNRGVGYPHTWSTSTKSRASVASNYDILEIVFEEEGDGFNTIKLPKSILIAGVTNGTNDVIDAIVAKLNTVTGGSGGTLS